MANELKSKRFQDNNYIVHDGMYYPALLQSIKKSNKFLQPIFEAFTNSLESLKEQSDVFDKHIKIKLYHKIDLFGEITFEKIVVEDSGVGFNEESFDRFQRFKDDRKGSNNRGSGRIQYLHFFKDSEFLSTYENESLYIDRNFIFSKAQAYLQRHSIIFHKCTRGSNHNSPLTSVTFSNPWTEEDNKLFSDLRASKLKEELINRYISYFCSNRNNLPEIKVEDYLDDNLESTEYISAEDVPELDKSREITVHYSVASEKGDVIKVSPNQENFELKAYKISKNTLKKNKIYLTSKGEVAKKVGFESLSDSDTIDGMRYLFLLSGSYIDQKDGDNRGELSVLSRSEFEKNLKQQELDANGEILFDDIQTKVNVTIAKLYPEIAQKKIEHKHDIEKLRKMFLLNEDTLSSLKFSINDSEESILQKVYKSDMEIVAKNDARIKKQVESLDELDPNSDTYQEKLDSVVSELVEQIPIQNRTALTHYVARRKLVLDLFDRVLDKELQASKESGRNINEALLHNILFQQSSTDPSQSDLWIINEDFIYFKGHSEGRLCDIEVDGEKMLKKEFTLEEEKYLNSLGERRQTKRPDVLLFPDEGKCIILEFKHKDVNVSEHLTQINKYAYLIRNFSKEKFQIDTFYGYLIGEGIEARDIRAADSDFKHSYHFDYHFRPSKAVVGEDDRSDGSLYKEVIKYSTLLKKAQLRNKVFIEKLMNSPKV